MIYNDKFEENITMFKAESDELRRRIDIHNDWQNPYNKKLTLVGKYIEDEDEDCDDDDDYGDGEDRDTPMQQHQYSPWGGAAVIVVAAGLMWQKRCTQPLDSFHAWAIPENVKRIQAIRATAPENDHPFWDNIIQMGEIMMRVHNSIMAESWDTLVTDLSDKYPKLYREVFRLLPNIGQHGANAVVSLIQKIVTEKKDLE